MVDGVLGPWILVFDHVYFCAAIMEGDFIHQLIDKENTSTMI